MSMGILVFGFGLAAGFLAAFIGLGFLADSAAIVIAALLVALLVAGLAALVLILLRKRLMRSIFGFAEAEIDRFSTPLGRVADAAIARDPLAASEAARELVQLSLARYAWISTRRWVVASLTALIAAMAALGGTALLFKQNQLIGEQLLLLERQNLRIDQQTRLINQDVELAEAARNAELSVEVTQIAAEIGKLAEEGIRASGEAPNDFFVPSLDPVRDVPISLTLRIVALSQAMRPYRFLQNNYDTGDDQSKLQIAMNRQRERLPETYARMAEGQGWSNLGDRSELLDRPASPERGNLLSAMVQSGIGHLELLNLKGLNLSFAYLHEASFMLVTMQGAKLTYADFTGSVFDGCDLGGSYLENTRFRRAWVLRTSFSSVTEDKVRAPFRPSYYSTQLAGADFEEALISDVGFAGVNALAITFEGATLLRPDFTGAVLAAGSFEGAVVIAPVWDGADLRSTEFDGAILFGEDALAQIAAAAAPGTFKPENFTAEVISMDEVFTVNTAYANFSAEEIAEAAGGPPVRIKRVAGQEG